MPRPAVPIVLLAAGLGSRFGGGVKPLAPVGPAGEPLVLLGLQQAAAAGIERAVVVTSAMTRSAIASALTAPPLPVALADQDTIGPRRARPWGTVAAVLAGAAGAGGAGVNGTIAANGDDLYGVAGLRVAADWLRRDTRSDALLVAYPVAATLAPTGGVPRGLVASGPDGRLCRLRELRDVERRGRRIVAGTGEVLAEDALVSMNLWAFRPSALDALAAAWRDFLALHSGDAEAELGLPDTVAAGVATGDLAVDLVSTTARWYGVTWPSDVERVRAQLMAAEDDR